MVEQAIEDFDVGRSGLYHELRSRDRTLPGMRGVSDPVYVDGSEYLFWVLRPTLATPRMYTPDPHAEPRETAGPLGMATDEQATETAVATDGDGESDGFESVGGSV